MICPINIVNINDTIYFIHYCNDKCSDSNHEFENNLYIRNMYFFKAI